MPTITNRQGNILKTVIESYIGGAHPISSDFLNKSGYFRLSTATLRAEMATLERSGFLMQPHTSSGRIPTELAYRFFVEKNSSTWNLSNAIRDKLSQILKIWKQDKVSAVERAAEELADFFQGVSLVNLNLNNNPLFFQRLNYFRSQPEFYSHQVMDEMLNVLELLQSRRNLITESVDIDKTQVLIGKDIRLGKFKVLSLIIKPWHSRYGYSSGFIAAVGPMRMHYERAIPAVDFLGSLISEEK